MARKLGLIVLVALLSVAWAAPTCEAAKKETSTESAAQQVTQAELAQLLVNVLGLYRFLPASPTPQECFAVLLDNNISPEKGWKAEDVVTRADLARVIVQALQRTDEIENPDDPKEWIDLLKEMGVPIDSVGQAVDNVGPLAEPVALNVFEVTTDPLKTDQRRGEPDETESGADAEFVVIITTIGEIQKIVDFVQPPPPVHVTPNAP
ncbi:MAG: hypothetical protein KJ626_04020 [Verrucomicrobia bacterium]|nr:hypothetical protein [Verrucomicrobiota bacterium]